METAAAKTIWLRNNRASAVVLPPVLDVEAKKNFPALRLLPKDNQIPAEYFDEIKDRKDIKGMFAAGTIERVAKGDPVFPDGARQTLKGYSEADAIKMVQSCSDGEQLGRWADSEQRGPVLKAILGQADEIAKRAKPKA